MENYHKSVLLHEAVEALQIKPGKKYIDATLGGGGHTLQILERGGIVLGIDADADAIVFVKDKINDQSARPDWIGASWWTEFKTEGKFSLIQGNFRDIDSIAKNYGFVSVSGILFDLGVSSHQLDTSERGFSFAKHGVLDMRMDKSLSVSARELINGLGVHELEKLFIKLGEEPYAKKIAQSIVHNRKISPIISTTDLATIIQQTVLFKKADIHPATRIFQALRIAVNDELHALEEALPKSLDLLENGGRLVVISFHSMEDRIVKHTFIQFEQAGNGKIITEKPIVPTQEELAQNRRARSAKLRVFEKTL